MLKYKTFVKKTKRGGIIKIVREHYLREDIGCGSAICLPCVDLNTPVLEHNPVSLSSLCMEQHYIIPDTNVVLHQIDVLEDAVIKNVIVLQTVLEEVRHRSAPAYKRIKDIVANPDKCFYVFSNEFHKDTYIERLPGETVNDRNDRAIREAAIWYHGHLPRSVDRAVEVVLLTNDVQNKNKAKAQDIIAYTVHEYVKSLKGCTSLVDRLAQNPDGDMPIIDGQPKYTEHMPLSEIQRRLKTGGILQGSYQASRYNYLEGYISVQDADQMIFVQGLKNQNRAVQDDVVALEMLPEEEWSCPSSLILEEAVEEEKSEENIEKEDKLVKNKVPKDLRQPTARVVGIIRRKWRQYCGILQLSVLKESTRHLFVPAEKRIPKIRIETRQASELAGQRIVVAIDSWPRNSRYPQGHYVRRLGNVGDKDTENEVLLLEHDVPHSGFSEAVLSFLPKMPWSIKEEDMKYRTDLRHITICSVDPPGCTDIDDALHCRRLENGILELRSGGIEESSFNYARQSLAKLHPHFARVRINQSLNSLTINFQKTTCIQFGVHIADVTHFIRPGTAIDDEASLRGTTVYLTDKRIDMVPELLSSNLCSLRGNEDRLSFSVLWEMTDEAEILKTTFTKSAICSRAALTYAEAQMIIDDPSRNDDIATGLRGLNNMAKILKQKRIDNGALTLASPEIRFHIDSETHDPIDVQAKELRETNSMVEEFMLLANISVATKITEDFPDCAVLRRHPNPPVSNFDPLLKAALSKGFNLNVTNGKALADSLNSSVIPADPYFNTMLRIMTTRCMMQAVYFSSGMNSVEEYFHYGLATPIYTHFTSPIRRFSDMMVHRLLAVAIGADVSFPELLDKRKTQTVCNNLNYRHKMAQYAGRASVNLHTHFFFKNRIVDEDGYILFVRKNAIQVLIPKYGLEATVYLQDADSKQSLFTFDEEKNTQTYGDTVIQVFDAVVIQISIDQSNVQHLKLKLELVKPHIPGFSVPPASENQTLKSTPSPNKKRKS